MRPFLPIISLVLLSLGLTATQEPVKLPSLAKTIDHYLNTQKKVPLGAFENTAALSGLTRHMAAEAALSLSIDPKKIELSNKSDLAHFKPQLHNLGILSVNEDKFKHEPLGARRIVIFHELAHTATTDFLKKKSPAQAREVERATDTLALAKGNCTVCAKEYANWFLRWAKIQRSPLLIARSKTLESELKKAHEQSEKFGKDHPGDYERALSAYQAARKIDKICLIHDITQKHIHSVNELICATKEYKDQKNILRHVFTESIHPDDLQCNKEPFLYRVVMYKDQDFLKYMLELRKDSRRVPFNQLRAAQLATAALKAKDTQTATMVLRDDPQAQAAIQKRKNKCLQELKKAGIDNNTELILSYLSPVYACLKK